MNTEKAYSGDIICIIKDILGHKIGGEHKVEIRSIEISMCEDNSIITEDGLKLYDDEYKIIERNKEYITTEIKKVIDVLERIAERVDSIDSFRISTAILELQSLL